MCTQENIFRRALHDSNDEIIVIGDIVQNADDTVIPNDISEGLQILLKEVREVSNSL